MSAPVITALKNSVAEARAVIAAVSPDQYHLLTPGTDWTVGQLINHMIGMLSAFTDCAAGGVADPAVLLSRDLVRGRATSSFDAAASEAVAAWSANGSVDRTAKLSFGEFPATYALRLLAMDLVVHAWDLARATGTQVDWNRNLVLSTLSYCETTIVSPVSPRIGGSTLNRGTGGASGFL